ncbi:alpha/beta fold hydrolase [Streptomyces sp. SID3343]|uniref:alpha/beta fold hydrolase n=1 Tax=Streptomyces sp. SID3343 TaxID=2690260 RepID=UPI00136BE55E|nr:alpha/beta fold hydrolase [Streptomyces sp. SID3343]MYV99624.1 alpha/beta fold hydrolase [Streptomyces sp. SID3343]
MILVGHSYAGLVVRQAADLRPERVGRIVRVDGWAGPDGTGMSTPAPAPFTQAVQAAAATNGDRRQHVPAPAPAAFGVTDPDDARWLTDRLRLQPLRSFAETTHDDIRYRSMIHSARSNARLAEITRQGVNVLGRDSAAAARLENVARFLDFVGESMIRATEAAREIFYGRTKQLGRLNARAATANRRPFIPDVEHQFQIKHPAGLVFLFSARMMACNRHRVPPRRTGSHPWSCAPPSADVPPVPGAAVGAGACLPSRRRSYSP